MKVRAYKLAQELGIDRNEFVERAAAEGVELKNPMAALEPEQVDLLRAKLGTPTVDKSSMDEERVESKSGSTIVRRRRRQKAPAPAPPAPALAPEPEPVTRVEPDPEPSFPVEDEAVPEPIAAEEPAEPQPAPSAPAPQPAAVSTGPSGSAPARKRPEAEEPPDRKGKQRKRVREVVNLREQEQVKLQYTARGVTRRRTPIVSPRSVVNPRSKRRDKLSKPAAGKASSSQPRSIRVDGEISVGELAKALGAKAPAIQGKLMALGIMVSVNQTVDVETAGKLASEMGFEVQDTGFKEAEFFDVPADGDESDRDVTNLEPRSPVITVMGHVDHGKTSILDAIRKTSIVDGEAGGITQHIGAYQTEAGGNLLTFIDTPGHAAFTQMRARGAAITDMVVLVVAATEGVMPQTVEAIQHARAAGCPIVVAVNKIDLPGANSPQIRQRLMEHELVAEDFGGDTIFVDVSAKTGQGLDQLLEMLALQAEVLELKADPSLRARGVVLEASLSKGRGPVATVLVQEGTLKTGDIVVCETEFGRVRTMENDKGERVDAAGPSVPVQVMGLSGVPSAGAHFNVVESERVAKRIVGHREDLERGQPAAPAPKLTLEEFFARADGGEQKELPVILKADVQGTCEAVKDALEKMSTDAVSLRVISTGVGGITENDVTFAKASDAIVVGFHSRPDPAARAAAEQQGIEIRTYTIIYELLDDVRAAMAGLLPPTVTEVMLGRAEVRQPFSIPRIGTIAGSYVTEGTIKRNAHCRLIRDGIQIYEGRVGSLRRFKDDASEVKTGFECGIGIDGYNDVKEGDVIEAFELKEEAATL